MVCRLEFGASRSSKFVQQFKDRASVCASIPDLELLLTEAADALGFRFFALLHHASIRAFSPRLVLIHNYPATWERELKQRQGQGSDPVHTVAGRLNIGFRWEDLGSFCRLSDAQLHTMKLARRFGIQNGFTVPANIPGEPNGSTSFAGPIRRPSRACLHSADLVGALAFHTARRIQNYLAKDALVRLSRRERECIRLVARGKTDWEIAAILGLATDTVHQYVKRARAAYSVTTRTQLVVHGLRDSVVTYDDAIPQHA